MELNKIHNIDCLSGLKLIEDNTIDCIVTSPPYWGLRDYGNENQLGLEKDYNLYISKLCDIFDEIKRVLKKDGTCFVNLGDTYGGTGDKNNFKDPKYKNGRNGQVKSVNKNAIKKSLCQIPSRFAIEMCNRGWILRNEIIWHKPNVMPTSVKDRFTVDYEKLFFFTKSKKYYFEQQKEKAKWGHDKRADRGRIHYEGGKRDGLKGTGQENFVSIKQERNIRCVWTINTKPFKGSHFAVFPEELIEVPIKSSCPKGGIVLYPFMGSGTTAIVSLKQNKNFIGFELNADYIEIANKRINNYTNLKEWIK